MSWKDYYELWPSELDSAQRGLNSNVAKGIFIYLLLNSETTFSNLSKELQIEDNKLSYHLKNLVRSGLLTQKYLHKKNQSERSYYSISPFGVVYGKKSLEIARSPFQNKLLPEHYETIELNQCDALQFDYSATADDASLEPINIHPLREITIPIRIDKKNKTGVI